MAFTKAQAFDLLVSLKVKKVEIKYQGGNDEGYVEDITFHTNDGTEKVEEDSCDEFHKVLCSPLYEAYGNFDGDFQVDGTLTWVVVSEDIRRCTITNTGEETRPQTDGYSREIEWEDDN